ncbi:MAG: hypothetical protein KBC00_00040 [Candidatus Levybacteria bacterium]|nr:hypothetical protein [Candidatus Levybacteria bacterium]MBP9815235.1 hypothetical protein [Candidatus Levybacteria bacterium]
MNNERNQAKIHPLKRITREVVRDAMHPFFLKGEGKEIVPGGLKKVHGMIDKGIGVVVVTPHVSAIDPFWVADSVTKEWRYRSTPLSGPVREDRLPSGFKALTASIGINLSPVVTPYQQIDKNSYRTTQEKIEIKAKKAAYESKSVKAIRDGEVVVVTYNGHRDSNLKQPSERTIGVVGNLIDSLITSEILDFGIHFAAVEISGETDYKRRSGLNIGLGYMVLHGNTYTFEEFFELSKLFLNDTSKTKGDRLRAMDKATFQEFLKIVPVVQFPINV